MLFIKEQSSNLSVFLAMECYYGIILISIFCILKVLLEVSSIESVWIDILLPKTKPILVGSVYRPPSQQSFLDDFELQLKRIDIDQECYILGDFNICVKNKKSSLNKAYLSLVSNSGYTQLINQPTRISEKPSTIDHIICSKTEKVSQSGVIHLSLSDHSLIYCTRKLSRQSFKNHNTVTIRSMKNYTPTNYADMLESIGHRFYDPNVRKVLGPHSRIYLCLS